MEVYARASEVELFLNKKSLGRKRIKHNCVATFHTKYQDGELTAVSYDRKGQKMKTATLKTADSTTNLAVLPESKETTKEGLTFIQLVYTDENGIWKPMEKHTVHVEVEHGCLKGLGNACAYNLDGYDKDYVKTYYGRALAVVQADGTGSVVVRVKDESQEYKVEIPCK